MRPIDSEYLLERIDKCVAESGIESDPVMTVRDIKSLITLIPTANVISIPNLATWLAAYASPPRYALDYVRNNTLHAGERNRLEAENHNMFLAWEFHLHNLVDYNLC